ncbi:MAG: GNAT family N-acetyltransferase [Pseudomonadota bacterium]
MTEFQIRATTAAEFATAVEWAAQEGWNPGHDDLAAFHAADPDGFLMGFLNGEPITSISVVRYGAAFGFLGFYIARPDMRGRGYGWKTWQAGLRHLEGRTIGLDGVLDQQDNYRKSGFSFAGRTIRYSGSFASISASADVTTQSMTPNMVDRIMAYDRPFFPDERCIFIRNWLLAAAADSRWSLAALSDGDIAGYGVIRACREGFKIGPLFANDRSIAETIIARLCQSLPDGAPITIDIPEPNTDAIAMAQSLGFAPNFETARMYKGSTPDLPIDRTFGITTFELG